MIPNREWDLSTRETGKGEPYESVILRQQHSDAGVDLANSQGNKHLVRESKGEAKVSSSSAHPDGALEM